METTKQSLGKLGEDLAVNFLKNRGYRILARNFKTSRFGEIDIVAQEKSGFLNLGQKGQLVFVEVKTKSSDQFGLPEEEFTFYKKQHLRRAIQDYFWTKKIETNNWRIDLIAVDFTENEENPEIRHYQGVF